MLHVVLHWTIGMDFGVRLCSFARVVVSIVVVWLFTERERGYISFYLIISIYLIRCTGAREI